MKRIWQGSMLIVACGVAAMGFAQSSAEPNGAPNNSRLNLSPLFIELSDAMAQVKQQQAAQAKPHLHTLKQQFEQLENHQSDAGKVVAERLNQALTLPDQTHLDNLAKALYAFEKEQNPVDYHAKRQQFAKRVMPIYRQLQQAVQSGQLEQIQAEYKQFNQRWTLNEKVVRETSLGHYGKIEKAMSLLRIAMLSEPANHAEMEAQSALLGEALADFNAGNVLKPQLSSNPNAPKTLPDGIKLLEQAYLHLAHQEVAQGRAAISLFFQQWILFEDQVRTRDIALYTRVQTELGEIMAKADHPDSLTQFRRLIDALQHFVGR